MAADKSKKLAVGKAILETFDLENKVNEINNTIANNKLLIQEYFDMQNVKQLQAQNTNKNGISSGPLVTAKKREITRIKYDPVKLKEKLDPELFNEVSQKTYTINNIEAMIALLKSAGASASEFKKLIDVDITVNSSEIKRLYEEKEISLKSIEGCYTATISKSIIISEDKSGDKD